MRWSRRSERFVAILGGTLALTTGIARADDEMPAEEPRTHRARQILQQMDEQPTSAAESWRSHFQIQKKEGFDGLGYLAGGLLGGERSSLAGAFEAHPAGARPGHHVAFHIGNRHVGVVERRLDVRDATQERTLFLLLEGLAFALLIDFFLLCHSRLPLPLLAALGPFARPRVRVGALASGRQRTAMTKSAIGSDVTRTGVIAMPLGGKATPTVATTVLLAVAITETVPSVSFVT